MKLTVVYNYPVFGGDHDDFAMRFAMSYTQFPPGEDHDTLVISNGGEPTKLMRHIMECVGTFQNLRWFSRNNTAKDLGGYQDVSRGSSSDLLVFFGGSTFFWKAGWLKPVVESFRLFGNTLYGAMAGGMVLSQRVYPHIRTTGFWTTPLIMNKYPNRVRNDNDRYEMEHRKDSLTMWAARRKFFPKIVTWSNIYDMKDWETIPDGFHRSDQSGLLFKDRLTEDPFHIEKRTHAPIANETNSDILPLPFLSGTTTKIPRGVVSDS